MDMNVQHNAAYVGKELERKITKFLAIGIWISNHNTVL